MRNRVTAFVTNNIATDQRLAKVGSTLVNNGYDFKLIGFNHRGAPVLDLPFKTKRLNLFFQKNVLFYAEIQLRIFLYLLKHRKKINILLANDLDTLLPVYLISKILRKPLVFDSHEIFSELPSLKQGSVQKKVWQTLEKYLVPKLKNAYTVSESYARFFKEKYDTDFQVVRNLPRRQNKLVCEEKETQKKILIYQGAVKKSRGIDAMILAMEYLANKELWIVGDGPQWEEYKALAKEQKVESKVKFLGRVLPDELREITPKADLGLSLEEAQSLSYKYALPNKIFDYVQARIPVLGTSNLPELYNVITTYKIGEYIGNYTPRELAQKIEQMLKVPPTMYKEHLQRAAQDLVWEKEEERLLSVFAKAHK